ncbi:hypothetical protein CVT25_006841 [Psilocybe cyanescens]|uniref:DNA repair and recombination protein RAD52 n=1 Tax=Psilocybe cyanescens TaxID=93625 RepID=A0A409X7F7_PSICY|nr:hypothetical protein CVT25_006841 [Psilocybe cyanescens]
MSFNPMMHGTPYAQQSFSLFNSPSFANDSISEETAKKIATLQVKLDQKLGPEYISQRPGPGGGPKLTYVEGWKIINLANEVFGFNGWSSSIVNLTTDFTDYNEETRRYSVGVTAIMRVTLKDGVFHEDTGYGMLENSKSKGAALDKCKKEAVTDGLKRALRNFGNVLGNCLYDKSYTSEIVKVKFEPVKFNRDELHRRPEFDDVKPNISTSTTSTSAGPSNHTTNRPYQNQIAAVTPTRPPYQQNQAKPLTSLPAHMRSGLNSAPTSSSTSVSNTSINRPVDYKGKGLANPQQRPNVITTPITTPEQRYNAHKQQQQQNQNNERRASFPDPNTNKTAAVPPPPAQVSKPSAAAAPPAAVKHDPNLDDDDSFDFGSEDDALFAMADLGPPIGANDADLGRPIDSDVETGRPIDQEEGLLQGMQDAEDDSAVFAVHPGARSAGAASAGAGSAGSGQNSSSSSNSTKSRQDLIAAALRGDVVGSANDQQAAAASTLSIPGQGLATGMLSSKLNPPQQQARSNPSYGSASGPAAGTSKSAAQMPPPGAPAQNHQHAQTSRTSSISQKNHQRHLNQRQQQQQQQQNQNVSAATNAGQQPPARASTPAVGGFNFPAGVRPAAPSPNFTTTTSIGVKRSIEATGSSNYRGARPGMGLTAASSTTTVATTAGVANANGKREVLGALDVEEGGTVKRARQW